MIDVDDIDDLQLEVLCKNYAKACNYIVVFSLVELYSTKYIKTYTATVTGLTMQKWSMTKKATASHKNILCTTKHTVFSNTDVE